MTSSGQILDQTGLPWSFCGLWQGDVIERLIAAAYRPSRMLLVCWTCIAGRGPGIEGMVEAVVIAALERRCNIPGKFKRSLQVEELSDGSLAYKHIIEGLGWQYHEDH